jgi:hypothetical protein
MVFRKKAGTAWIALMVGLGFPAAGQVTVPAPMPPIPAEKLTPACATAKTYVALIDAQRLDEVGTLFADKVDYVGPDAVHRDSGAEVTKVYADIGQAIKKYPPKMRITRLSPVNGNECFLEFDSYNYATHHYVLLAVDHFITDAQGRVIFFRPFFQQALIWPSLPKP